MNESRNNNRQKARANRNQNKNQQQNRNQANRFNARYVNPVSTGLIMYASERFKYILSKMSESGNKIAKDFLLLLDNKEKKFEMSYIDLTSKEDSLSYLTPGASGELKDEDKYKSNKRQYSKIYKLIKTIFGNKFTKEEVKKFVSVYKSVYNKGPEKKKEPGSDENILKKIVDDTKNDKLKWSLRTKANNWVCYEAGKKYTEYKGVVFSLYIFDPHLFVNSFLSMNFINNKEKDPDKKSVHIKTFNYGDIIEFIKDFSKKYKVGE